MSKPKEKQNISVAEIFDEKNLSARFFLYQRDITPKGRALYLCQLLMHLKKWFPEFQEILDHAITKARALGSATPESQKKLILKSVRNFAATESEISEETHISKSDVRKLLKELINEKLVFKKKHPASNDYRDELYFPVREIPEKK